MLDADKSIRRLNYEIDILSMSTEQKLKHALKNLVGHRMDIEGKPLIINAYIKKDGLLFFDEGDLILTLLNSDNTISEFAVKRLYADIAYDIEKSRKKVNII